MSDPSIDILHIEDNPGDALLLQEYIHQFDENKRISVDLAEDLETGFDRLSGHSYDLIFLDLGLPGISGLDAVKLLLEKFPDSCIVVLSGNQNLEMAKEALHLGAQDYLTKNDLKSVHIEKAITFAMERFAMKKQLQSQKDELYQLTAAVEQSSNIIVITNTKGRIEYVNEKFCEVTGYTKEEAKGQNPSILSSGEQPKEFYQELWSTIIKGNTWKGQFLNKRKDGSLFWERATITPTYNSKGEIANYLAIKEDITEAKANEEILSFATEVAELGTWEWNTRNGNFEINQVLRNRLDLEEDESLEHISQYHKRIHPDDFEQAYNSLEDHLSGKTERYEAVYRLLNNHSRSIWVYDTGQIRQKDPQGEFFIMSGVSIDITTLKKQEIDLKFEQDQLLATQKLGKIGSWFYNIEEASFDYVSPANHEIMGWEKGQQFSRSLLLEKVHPEDVEFFDEKLDEMVEGKGTSFNFRISKNGQTHWIKLISTPTKTSSGKLEGVLVLVQDITEEYEQQSRIKASEKKFRTIFENATVGIVYQDDTGKIIEANKMASEILGIDHPELKEKSVYDDDWLFVDESLEELSADQMASQRVLKTLQPVSNFLMGIQNKRTSELRWITVDSFPLKDPLTNELTTCTIFNDITEEKLYQEKIETNEKRLSTAQKIASFAHWTYNFKDDLYEWSETLYELFRVESHNDLSEPLLFQNIHPDDKAKTNELIERSRQDFDLNYMSYRLLFPNGEVRYFEDSWEIQYDVQGKPSTILGVTHDITNLKKAEIKSAESRNQLLSILESIDDIVMMLNPNLECQEVFPGGEGDLLFPVKEFLHRPIVEYIPPHLSKALLEKVRELDSTGITQELEYSLDFKEKVNWYNAHITRVKGNKGQLIGYTLIIRNITQRKENEIEKVKVSEKLKSIIHSLDDTLIVIDGKGIYREYFKGKADQTTDLDYTQVIGLHYKDVLPDSLSDQLEGCLKKVIKHKKTQTFLYGENLMGKERFFHTTVSPLFKEGKIDGYTLLIRDITEQKKAQQALAESEERFRMQSEFLPHILWTTNAQGKTNYINEAGKYFYGDHLKTFFRKTWDGLYPDDRKTAIRKWNTAQEHKSSYFNLERHINSEGEYKWLNIKANPVIGDDGEIISWIGVSTNVDNEIRAKKANEKLVFDLRERVKEATCLYRISSLAESDFKDFGDLFGQAVEIIRDGFAYPEQTEVRITYGEDVYQTGAFRYKNRLEEVIKTGAQEYGKIEVALAAYDQYERKLEYLSEEFDLLASVAENLALIINQKLSIVELAESEKRFRTLLYNATIGIVLLKDGIVQSNKYIHQIFKYSEEELYGLDPWQISPKTQPDGQDSEEKAKELIGRLDSEKVVNFIWHHLDKHGNIIVCDISLTQIQFSDGPYAMAFIKDITEAQKAQKALVESEEKYRSIFENIKDGYVLMDTEGEVLNINPAGAAILEGEIPQIIGFSFNRLITAKADFLKLVNQRNKALRNFDVEIININGKRLMLEFNLQLIEKEGKPYLIEGTFRDITESHRFNQYLNTSLQLYEAYSKPKEEFIQIGIDLGQELLQSKCAFFHEVDEDANKIKLIDWSTSTKTICEVPGLVADYDIDKAGIWTDCVESKKAEIHNNYANEKHKKGLPIGHFPIERDVEMPIVVDGKVVAIYGVGNKPEDYNQLDVELLSNYANLFYSLVERKELEEEYVETLETFEESQKIGQIGAFKTDYVYKNIWTSDKLFEIYGIDPATEEINFDNWIEFTHPEDREEHFEKHKEAFKTGYFEHEYRIRVKSGEIKYLYVKSQIEKNQEGKPIKELGLVQDITSLKKAQISYEERTQQFENIVSSIQGIVYRVKFPSNQVEFVSPYVEEMLGYSVEEIKNESSSIKRIVHPDDFENSLIDVEESLKKEKSFNVMFRLITKEQRTIWVNATGVLAEIEGGEFVIEGLIVDITERVRSEERVMNAFMEASDAERQRISKEIHDSLQQTLTIASLNLEFVKMEKYKLSQKIQDKFALGYDYLKKSLNDSRAIAHSLMPKAIEDFGFTSVVEAMVDDLNKAGKANFEFISNMKDLRFKVPIDTSLYKIAQEATNNIMKHAEADNVTIQYMKLGDTIQLTIEDDGKGFEVSDLNKSESGFGLASMRNRASSFGAEIFIDSYPGHGTTIMLEFPFSEHLLYIYEQD